MENKKILLIDGNSIINRAFYALPILTDKEGRFTNAVYGFLNIFFKLYDIEKPGYIAVAFDVKAPTFRHVKYTDYKANRKSMPDELRPQIPMLKSLLAKMDIKIYELEGYEADDILGTLAVKAESLNLEPVIVSGDKDLLQIASEKIKISIPKTKAGKTEVEEYFAKDVINLMGVTPKEYIDIKALMGDASDNIPGVPGIGEKTAQKIIKEFGSVENAITNAAVLKPKKASENIITYKDDALMSKELATILLDSPVDFNADDLKCDNMFNPESLAEVKQLGFKSHTLRFGGNNAFESAKPKSSQISLLDDNPFEDNPFEDNPFENSSDMPIENFNEITGLEQAKAFVLALLDKPIISFVTIFSPINGDKVLGISFSTSEEDGTFIKASDSLTVESLIEICRPLFESSVKKLTLNSKAEMIFALKNEVKLSNIEFDAILAAYILNSSGSSYNYDDIALDFLGRMYPSLDELAGKGKLRTEFEGEALLTYASRQANTVFAAYPVMIEKLKENDQANVYYDIELPLAKVLADMEICGIKADKARLTLFGQQLDEVLTRLTDEIHNLAGENFNINSPSQLGVILFEKLGLKGSKKTKQGYSTAAEVLEGLVNDHEIIQKILTYRTNAKLKSTYVDGLTAVMDEKTGKIYSTFNQTVTSTGRISSTEPNLQNIPIRLPIGRELRKAFIPTDESFVFIDGDYSQIELRVLAHMSGDETLIDAFNNGQDIHKLTASQVFHVPLDDVTDSQRSAAKAVNFGIVYGIGAFSLSKDIGVTVKEAEMYIIGYFRKYPNVKKYMDEMVASAKQTGYAATIFNRRRFIPEIHSSNFIQRSFGERVAMNMPIQGTAADIIKLAMIGVHRAFSERNLRSRLILQVHDELLVEAAKEEIEIVKEILRHEMENAANLKVRLVTDFSEGESWFDAK
ncbi:MAG: DNA polymerase I [Defluviitaleaceae bacterium]|nr:DNA polymerase I [Defluviitaleaceae bacterium]